MQILGPKSGRVAIVCLLAVGLGQGSLAAQGVERQWSTSARTDVQIIYDDNPFLLDTARMTKLRNPSSGDVASRRFKDMTSVSDEIVVPTLTLAAEGPGLFGRRFQVRTDLAYQANLQNTRRAHADLGLILAQTVTKAGRLRFEAEWQPSGYNKNYLANAVDLNSDGSISPDERRYRAGVTNQVDLALSYRDRLLKATKHRQVGITGALEATWTSQTYDNPFPGRSRSGPGIGAGLDVELGRRWTVGMNYSYDWISADPTREVLLLDETLFNRDFNGNGSQTDPSARAFEVVDRSRHEKDAGVSLAAQLSKVFTASAGFDRRRRDFTSTRPFDVNDRGRQDTLDELSAGLDIRMTHALSLALAGKHRKQTTNRSGDPASTGEVADYLRNEASASLSYRF
jgi:hypothetical protein